MNFKIFFEECVDQLQLVFFSDKSSFNIRPGKFFRHLGLFCRDEIRRSQQRNIKISGSESFTRWLVPGSELGARRMFYKVLEFPPPLASGSPQLAPLAPRASLGPWSLWGGKGLWARWEQAEAGSPPSQHTPLAPAHSQLSPASQVTPAHSQLAPSSLQPPSSLQLTPACSQLSPASQLAPAHSPCSSLLPACSSLLPALSSLPAHSSLLPALFSLPARSSSLPLLQLTPSCWSKGSKLE